MAGEYPRVPVNDEGRFSKGGTVTDVTGKEVDWKIKGRFKRPRKAVGTFDLDRQGCDKPASEFVAKPVG